MPESIWGRFHAGTDFDWLPFPAGYAPPPSRVVGWTYRFRFARIRVELILHDTSTELNRRDVILQFAEGDPPTMRGKAPACVVVGLWGGLLDDTKLTITPDPQANSIVGVIEF